MGSLIEFGGTNCYPLYLLPYLLPYQIVGVESIETESRFFHCLVHSYIPVLRCLDIP